MFNDDGLWNDRRPERVNQKNKAKETNRSLKILADEARVNSFQFSQLTNGMLRGASVSTNPEPSSIQPRAPIAKRVKPIRPSNNSQPSGLRTYNDIVNSDAYTQSDYRPRPAKVRTDHEKDRLANLMAYGIDPSRMPCKPSDCSPPSTIREIDRFDELVLEIEERKEFLEHMTLLGKRREYQEVIANEIADKIREMEQIDRQRSKALEQRLNKHSN